MSSGGFFQILVNLVFLASFVAIWIRLLKPAKDDPRLSRGLQLLQSKIAILEDLSDQVERQVQQVTQLIEAKNKDLQVYISHADDQIRKIESSKEEPIGSLEDLSDRQSTAKYVKAAQMAHQGASVEEIMCEVDISRAEVEFVIKVNRHQLQFSLEHLPEWAKQETKTGESGHAKMLETPPARTAAPQVQQPVLRVKDATISPLAAEEPPAASSGASVGQTLAARIAAANAKELAQQAAQRATQTGHNQTSPASHANSISQAASVATAVPKAAQFTEAKSRPSANGTQQQDDKGLVKKVVFPRIDINRNLG